MLERTVDPFAGIHRARRRRVAAISVGLTLTAAVFIALVWTTPGAAAAPRALPQPAVTASAPASADAGGPRAIAPDAVATDAAAATGGAPASALASGAAPSATAGAVPDIEPAASVATPPATAQQATGLAATAGPTHYTIAVDATGYQAELDRCLWVRMDVTTRLLPIVGAHNVCGGDIVLGMRPGDLVTLHGQRVDGDYVVTGSRDGHPGQSADEATAGLDASVLLQTCYWTGGQVRLVVLARRA